MPLLLRLCLLVNVPEPELVGLGHESGSSLTVSPTSFNCLVIDVRGSFGFIEGFLFIVPVGNSPHSKATSQLLGAPSDRHPLELELLALLSLPSLL